MIDIACSTHALLVDSALFAGPVVLCAVALWIAVRRDRDPNEDPSVANHRRKDAPDERRRLANPQPSL